ncbi:hypothetical protein M409DRAFT_23475 [Zasmidium cellare ATCC 36951]|uniref:Uncharacterized protein n=1 Tax=Zasmidium cellare ATCC 36951 TaxID=1080233 RepID=A0A6A6CGH1_ZASCE|nr:uncharacterized protein M409DRAFT_23475 [Zasmidium cellare ATCC 36951]KAF2166284.1 hypothetical protein M409DRAFT_23475 [Zasmidium cellare ATCC 36951]
MLTATTTARQRSSSNRSTPDGVVLSDVPGQGNAAALLRPQAFTTTNSPYPSIAATPPTLPSPRPRAHTYADPSMQQQGRATPVTPGGMQQNQQNQSQWPAPRHVSETQRAAPGYIPPPPPLQQQPPQPGMSFPPPPPRPPMSASQAHGPFVPPPPGQPTYWNRQPSSYPPPPPQQTQQQQREPRQYDPSLYFEYSQLPPLNPGEPLTSATYIPDGGSFGPGVGIPPLHSASNPPHAPPRPTHVPHQPSYYRGGSNDFSTGTMMESRYDGGSYNPDVTGTWFANPYQQPPPQQVPPTSHSVPPQNLIPPPTPTSAKQQKRLIAPANQTEQHTSPAETGRPPFDQVRSQTNETVSNRDHSSSGDTPASPQDQNWPAERVQIWLAAHNFSKEWQAAFQHLNVHGAQFLDIGRSGGQRNIGFMPQTVLPQVARECTANGVVWDQQRERDEGRRLRKYVRDVLKTGGAGTPSTAATSSTTSLPLRPNRRDSNTLLNSASAGTDGGGVENSPNLSRSDINAFGSTPTTAGGGDDSPGRTMPSVSQNRAPGSRSVTLDSFSSTLNDAERSAYTRSALANINDMRRQHSPSGSTGDLSTTSQNFKASPQQSPGLVNARPLANGNGHARVSSGTSSHLRGPSSEANLPLNNYSSREGRYYAGVTADHEAKQFSEDHPNDRRNAQDGSRPPPADGSRRDTPASAKEHRGFLAKFRRGGKRDDHPSPDDEHGPASPQATRNGLYGKPGAASSDISLGDRPTSRKEHLSVESADNIPPLPRGRPAAREGDKKFIFVTPDGWNYRLIDITDIESADQLRTVICYNLGVAEGPDVTMHLTAPGKMEHEEGLNDQMLMNARTQMADPTGNMKLYVRASNVSLEPPQSAGLGLQMPQSPFGQATFGGKPLDEATLKRLKEEEAGSPSTIRSGESTLVPDKARGLVTLAKEGESNDRAALQESMLQQDFMKLTQDQQQALLEARAQKHRLETERKQKFYQAQRRSQIIEGANGKRVHDFDSPRASPYETDKQLNSRPLSSGSTDLEKKSDSFQPLRRPPPVPEPTNTLKKADSLTKKQGPSTRTSWQNRKEEPWKRISGGSLPEEEGKRPGGGIGAALAGAGKAVGAIAAPGNGPNSAPVGGLPTLSANMAKSSTAPDLFGLDPEPHSMQSMTFQQRAASGPTRISPGTPRSPFTTMSKGGQPFRVPAYEEPDDEEDDEDTLKASQRPNLSLRTTSNPIARLQAEGTARSHSPDLSPSSERPTSSLNRMMSKRGHFEVPEYEVAFAPSPNVGTMVSSPSL